MSSELWMIEYERVGEQFAAGEIDEETARAKLKALGFDQDEIDEHIDVLNEDREPTEEEVLDKLEQEADFRAKEGRD